GSEPSDGSTSADADPTTGSSGSSTGQSSQAEFRTDVSSDRTGADAALLMLGWMLLAAGVVLLVLGRLRRRRTDWDYQR
ncbi:MAG: hypothetical protein K0Q93_1335, partial [Nocardioidaceae bacterium]|nr:hypothetical protein [Nocardioidaceae bacterium]